MCVQCVQLYCSMACCIKTNFGHQTSVSSSAKVHQDKHSNQGLLSIAYQSDGERALFLSHCLPNLKQVGDKLDDIRCPRPSGTANGNSACVVAACVELLLCCCASNIKHVAYSCVITCATSNINLFAIRS